MQYPLLLLLLLLLGCDPKSLDPQTPAPRSESILAMIDDRAITLDDLQSTLKEQSAHYQRLFETDEQKKTLLKELVLVRLLVEEAKKKGLENDPEVLRVQRRASILLLRRQLEQEWKDAQEKLPPPQRISFLSFYEAWLAKKRKEHPIRIEKTRWEALKARLEAHHPPTPPPAPSKLPAPAKLPTPTSLRQSAPLPVPTRTPAPSSLPKPSPSSLPKEAAPSQPASSPALRSLPSTP